MKPRPVRTHQFADSGYTTGGVKPQRICATCDMPERDQRHQLKPTTPEQTALTDRILGENKEHQPT